MKRIEELKKGDVVSCISSDWRHDHQEAIVASIGRKYIKVSGVNRSFDTYDRETLRAVDWGNWTLFPGTLDEYAVHKEQQHKADELRLQITKKLEAFPLGELKALDAVLTAMQNGYKIEYK